ncbi:MAG: hypothetical protein ABS96_32390 [Lysobacteraceae bacterium SCN 69-123]|nr:MAG: hypothetical protein ABS96_32390 [Xanthomonadaceae bacterium SCN 69-123]
MMAARILDGAKDFTHALRRAARHAVEHRAVPHLGGHLYRFADGTVAFIGREDQAAFPEVCACPKWPTNDGGDRPT